MKSCNWGAGKGDCGGFCPLVCMLKEALKHTELIVDTSPTGLGAITLPNFTHPPVGYDIYEYVKICTSRVPLTSNSR